LKERAEAKSRTIAVYDAKLAKTIISLRNGKEFEIDGEWIKDPPVTIIDKIARGVCWKDKLEMEKAEALYKNNIVTLNSIQAILNAYQSINKYQAEF
jgi:hypothetical protein